MSSKKGFLELAPVCATFFASVTTNFAKGVERITPWKKRPLGGYPSKPQPRRLRRDLYPMLEHLWLRIWEQRRALDELFLARGEERSFLEKKRYQADIKAARRRFLSRKAQFEACWAILEENRVPLINKETLRPWRSADDFLCCAIKRKRLSA